MGTYKTQKRYLSQDIFYETRTEPYFPNWSKSYPDGVPEKSFTSQETTSYRSSPVEDPLSTEAREEFVDVTRNGFTEANPRYDSGHPFFTTKTWIRLSHPKWNTFRWITPTTKDYWKGPLIPYVGSSSSDWRFPTIKRLSNNEISTKGAEMIRATIPTQSSASLATFLGEAVQMLPAFIGASLFQDRARYFNSLGSEYLNVQFGWLPFVKDIQDAAKAVSNSAAIIKQYKRDSGRVVRRKLTLPDIVTSSSSTYTPSAGQANITGLSTNFLADGSYGRPVRVETVRRETYTFSGAYSYLLNMDDTMFGRVERIEAEANRLLGTRLTPSVLWELTPWSWLTDWVWNVGDIISNASSLGSDGLVMRYGYLMRHSVEFQQLTVSDGVTFQGGAKTGPITTVFGRETKERVRGTPYGFGLDPSGFSVKRWAILGALGLTKGANILP